MSGTHAGNFLQNALSGCSHPTNAPKAFPMPSLGFVAALNSVGLLTQGKSSTEIRN